MYKWKPLANEEIKWLGIDFDRTIADNDGFPNFIPKKPLKGAVESLQKLNNDGYKITIFTARPWADYSNIESYCEYYNIPVRRIICGKPLLKAMIDDKNVAFDGDWNKALEDFYKIK